LVIYPVVQLKQRHFGVRRFVELMLLAIVDYLKSLGVEAEASLNPSGIWVPPKDKPPLRAGTDSAAKIGSAGLRVVRGVTNHGFSLNVTINQEPYGLFTSCGVAETTFTCISNEFDDVAPSLEELSVELTRVLARRLEGANLSGLSA
jgi:lipoate-protein ligase B